MCSTYECVRAGVDERPRGDGLHVLTDRCALQPDFPFIRFATGSRAFLARAIEHLAAYDRSEKLEHFFYAALELRFGIEARINEYLTPVLEQRGQSNEDVAHFAVSKLLKRLVEFEPDAEREASITVIPEQGGKSSTFHFTPVSKRLAAIHGQLGELLHFKFFVNNKHWLIRKPLGGQPHRSVADFLPLLCEGIEELRYATSGGLLTHFRFTQIVNDVLRDIDEGGSSADPSGAAR